MPTIYCILRSRLQLTKADSTPARCTYSLVQKTMTSPAVRCDLARELGQLLQVAQNKTMGTSRSRESQWRIVAFLARLIRVK